jgi:hypothetical protein
MIHVIWSLLPSSKDKIDFAGVLSTVESNSRFLLSLRFVRHIQNPHMPLKFPSSCANMIVNISFNEEFSLLDIHLTIFSKSFQNYLLTSSFKPADNSNDENISLDGQTVSMNDKF